MTQAEKRPLNTFSRVQRVAILLISASEVSVGFSGDKHARIFINTPQLLRLALDHFPLGCGSSLQQLCPSDLQIEVRKLLQHIFHNKLGVNPVNYRVSLCVPLHCPPTVHAILVDTLLRVCYVNNVLPLYSPLMIPFATEEASSLLLEVNDSYTLVLPVVHGYLLHNYVTLYPIGSVDVAETCMLVLLLQLLDHVEMPDNRSGNDTKNHTTHELHFACHSTSVPARTLRNDNVVELPRRLLSELEKWARQILRSSTSSLDSLLTQSSVTSDQTTETPVPLVFQKFFIPRQRVLPPGDEKDPSNASESKSDWNLTLRIPGLLVACLQIGCFVPAALSFVVSECLNAHSEMINRLSIDASSSLHGNESFAAIRSVLQYLVGKSNAISPRISDIPALPNMDYTYPKIAHESFDVFAPSSMATSLPAAIVRMLQQVASIDRKAVASNICLSGPGLTDHAPSIFQAILQQWIHRSLQVDECTLSSNTCASSRLELLKRRQAKEITSLASLLRVNKTLSPQYISFRGASLLSQSMIQVPDHPSHSPEMEAIQVTEDTSPCTSPSSASSSFTPESKALYTAAKLAYTLHCPRGLLDSIVRSLHQEFAAPSASTNSIAAATSPSPTLVSLYTSPPIQPTCGRSFHYLPRSHAQAYHPPPPAAFDKYAIHAAPFTVPYSESSELDTDEEVTEKKKGSATLDALDRPFYLPKPCLSASVSSPQVVSVEPISTWRDLMPQLVECDIYAFSASCNNPPSYRSTVYSEATQKVSPPTRVLDENSRKRRLELISERLSALSRNAKLRREE